MIWTGQQLVENNDQPNTTICIHWGVYLQTQRENSIAHTSCY